MRKVGCWWQLVGGDGCVTVPPFKPQHETVDICVAVSASVLESLHPYLIVTFKMKSLNSEIAF